MGDFWYVGRHPHSDGFAGTNLHAVVRPCIYPGRGCDALPSKTAHRRLGLIDLILHVDAGFCLDAFEQTEIESQFHANFRTTVWIDRELLMDFQAARLHGNDGK